MLKMLKETWDASVATYHFLWAKWYAQKKPASWKTLDKAVTRLVRGIQSAPEEYREELRQVILDSFESEFGPDMMKTEEAKGWITAVKNA